MTQKLFRHIDNPPSEEQNLYRRIKSEVSASLPPSPLGALGRIPAPVADSEVLMSSAVISAAAVPPPFTADILRKPAPLPSPNPKSARVIQIPAGVITASRLNLAPEPVLVPTGISEIDALIGGLPRGALTEIFGPASSGRTSLLLSSLASATCRQEICALVDAGDAFHPESATAAGLDLDRLLWVRCASGHGGGRSGEKCLEQTLKTTDLLLQSGGFGMVVVDLGDLPAQFARRIPLTSWFRFRRAVENTPTVLLVLEQEPYAKTCASLVLRMEAIKTQPSAFSAQHSASQQLESAAPAHAQILRGLPVQTEIVHARIQRKPVRSAAIAFKARTAWAG